MTFLPRRRHVVALAIAATLAAGFAHADPGGPAPSPGTGVFLFLSYQGSSRPEFDPAALQAGCRDRVHTTLRELGIRDVPREDLDASVRKWGVRSDRSVSAGFLKDLADEHQMARLLVCDVIAYPDRVLICARSVGNDRGNVEWADIEEQPLSPGQVAAPTTALEPWLDAATEAADRLLRRWRAPHPGGEGPADLFLLPVRTEGLDSAAGRIVMVCLLRSLMDSRWTIEDPGVTFSRFREAGYDPSLLDGRARPTLALAGPGANHQLLICDLIVEVDRSAPQEAPLAEDEPSSPPEVLPAASISVRLVDGGSGYVTFAATEVLEPAAASGLFGTAKNVSIVQRVQSAADRILHAAQKKG